MWRIKNWDQHFENNKSREVVDARWVPMTNKQDGDGYLSLISSTDGYACYGAFVAIVLLASKCKPRGDLRQSNGVAHSIETIARKVHFPAALIQKTITRCCEPSVDWIEVVADDDGGLFANPAQTCPVGKKAPECLSKSQVTAGSSARIGIGNGIQPPPVGGGNSGGGAGGGIGVAVLKFHCVGEPSTWWLTIEHLNRLIVIHKGLRVLDCLTDLSLRQVDDLSLRRSAGAMPAYLTRWLKQEVDHVRKFVDQPAVETTVRDLKPTRNARQPSLEDRARAVLEKSS